MPEVQRIMLERLRLAFRVDTSPADGLTGADLQAWIDAADEALFLRLMAERAAQAADRELARGRVTVRAKELAHAAIDAAGADAVVAIMQSMKP